ncbi:hypothetical protein AVEN_33800-1 [Araneus ventricosus]|uniref:Uncharacterized protein n=1 Tax=Araneus ventricosus TaxID=182803 RepID=A0A4Y2NP45_ARAVE|nr:hypothetical protein AVEN_33800-1 [Araneus ventricosus]
MNLKNVKNAIFDALLEGYYEKDQEDGTMEWADNSDETPSTQKQFHDDSICSSTTYEQSDDDSHYIPLSDEESSDDKFLTVTDDDDEPWAWDSNE